MGEANIIHIDQGLTKESNIWRGGRNVEPKSNSVVLGMIILIAKSALSPLLTHSYFNLEQRLHPNWDASSVMRGIKRLSGSNSH